MQFLVESQEKLKEMCFQLNESMLEGNQILIKEEYPIQGRGALTYKFEETGSLIPNVSSIIKSYYFDLETLSGLNVLKQEHLDYVENIYNPEKEYIVILFVVDIILPFSKDVGNLYHFDVVKFHNKRDIKDDYLDAKDDIQKVFDNGEMYEKEDEDEEKSGITEID